MKRDNVLESVDGKVLVKDAYLDPVENLVRVEVRRRVAAGAAAVERGREGL